MASNTTPPQSPTAWMKYRYGGWIDDIPEITNNGIYTLHNVWSETNNAYKITSPTSTKGEIFVIEYRNKNVYWDKDLPGSGLLIYRIDPNIGAGGWGGNAGGPPDELYIYRPGGVLNMAADGSLGGAYFSSQSGRTNFNNVSNPSCFLSSNTSNPGGTGLPGGIAILNIGPSGEETMTFEVDFSMINTRLHVSTNTLIFRSIPIGTTSEPQAITVYGDDLAYDISYEITSNNDGLFTVEETDWTPAAGGILTIRFTPETTKIQTARLLISSAGATSQAVTLKAQGSSVGIDDITTGLKSIEIYPNPTTGELRVESGKLRVESVEVFDVVGNLAAIPSPNWRGGTEGRGEMNISHLPPGIYFIRIRTEQGVVVKKLIKR
jgi:hypothetical protein